MTEEIKTHPMAMFYVEGGMYTIEELEEMLTMFKAAKKIQDVHLAKAIQPTKEKQQ